MNTNYEIYNFLNMINPRLGKVYKLTGFSPLPRNFVMTKELLKERLYLNQMSAKIVFPDFIYENKSEIKKYFKNSVKNMKKIKKNISNFDFSPEFSEKLNVYFNIRIDITKSILSEFKNQRFDEKDAFQEIYQINPILSKMLDGLFDEHTDLKSLLNNLEDKYEISYLEKLQLIEKKQKVEREKKSQIVNEQIKENQKNLSINKKKTSTKTKEKVSKIEKKLKNDNNKSKKEKNVVKEK